MDVDLKNVSIDKVDERYNYLFDVNSKEKANSFYLQSKIYWAAERLKSELKEKDAAAKGEKSEAKPEGGEQQAKP